MAPLGHHPPEARLAGKNFYNTHADAIDILAEIHDPTETTTQIKVQENGEYITSV